MITENAEIVENGIEMVTQRNVGIRVSVLIAVTDMTATAASMQYNKQEISTTPDIGRNKVLGVMESHGTAMQIATAWCGTGKR